MKTHACSSRSWYLTVSLIALAAARPVLAQDANSFPTVTIQATDPVATEGGSDTGTFTVIRQVATDTPPPSTSLVVFYRVSGTASNGGDYQSLSGSVTIPPLALGATIAVTPIDDAAVEGEETVVVQLTGSPLDCATCGYNIGEPGVAETLIRDNDLAGTNHPPFVQLNLPHNWDVSTTPVDIVLRAYAQDAEDPFFSLKVEFFEGTNSLGLGTFVGTRCAAPFCPYFALTWSNAPPGDYTLTARATDSDGASSVSGPVHITVFDGVNIYATDPVATEQPATSTIPPDTATFTVRRSGHTNVGLVVYYMIGGTASDGVDYQRLSGQVTIPKGALSAEIVVDPIDDNLVEGTEDVVLTLIPPCPPCLFSPPLCAVDMVQGTNCYPIGPDNQAMARIRDVDATNLPPTVRMTSPQNGQVFTAPANLLLMADARDREDFEIHRIFELTVEFFEGTNSLGLGTFVDGLCPICPFYWLTWSNVPPGQYTLTAKATDSEGAGSVSEPIHISVLPLPGTKLWELDRGIVYSSAAVGGDGTVYVPAGNAIVNLYALTPGGDTKWVQNLAGGGSSPAIADDGTIYVARADGQNTFRAYNPNGTVRWSLPLNVTGTFLGFASPAIARDGTIYVGAEGSLDKGLHALRPDGTLKWKFVPAGNQVLTPIVGTDGTIYFGASNDGLYAVNPDGTQRWNLPMTGHHIWAVVAGDGTIYVVGSISPTKLLAFAPDGVKKWESQIGPETSQYSSAPVIGPDGTIFVVSDRLYAFNRDGSGKWAFTPPANLGHSAVSPAVDSQGNVYAGLGGSFVAVSASGSLLWSFATGGPTFTAPTLTANGIVYVGAGDVFYAFQANAGLAESPWPMFQRDTRHTGAAPPTSLLPVVNMVARDPFASEGKHFWRDYPDAHVWAAGIWNVWHVNVGGTNTATFVVRRYGSTGADLTVNYEIGGTASNGVDYVVLPGSVTIAAGKRSARIVVMPIDDTLFEGIETVAFKLKPSPDYTAGFPSHAAAFIIDNDHPRPPCVMLRDRRFHLCWPATNGFCFRIEASTDLRNWIPICTNVVTDGALHFVDPDATPLDRRFYRVAPESGLPADD